MKWSVLAMWGGRLDRPNPPAHEYAGELLLGGEPKELAQAVEFEGSEYSLDITFDKDYLSPALGSTITGTVRLLKDGQPVSEAPDDLWPPTYSGTGTNPTGTPLATVSAVNTSRAGQGTDVATKYTPGTTTQLYSPGYRSVVTDSRGQPQSIVGLDLSDGEAQFEYRYGGGRTHPFVEFNVSSFAPGAGYALFQPRKMTTQVGVYFEDQVRSNVNIPDLNQAAQADFYYDVKATTVSGQGYVTAGQPEVIKIEITSRDSATGRINTNPYQRVQVTPQLVSKFFHSGGRSSQAIAGDFVATNDEVITTLVRQSAVRPLDYSWITIDLIEGRGVAYMRYTGAQWLAPYITFTVTPEPYYVSGSTGGIQLCDNGARPCTFEEIKENAEASRAKYGVSYRSEMGITPDDYPPKPDLGPDEWGRDQSRYITRLYQDGWYSAAGFNDLIGRVYTVVTVPVK